MFTKIRCNGRMRKILIQKCFSFLFRSFWVAPKECISQTFISSFMYRRPILWTLYSAVDFLKVLKIAVVGGGGGCVRVT
jgi:hypothetical protein